ncbi:MAG TPA: hypothetical protein VGR89_03410 [Puia sp.]|nr:hypothetical protein [Puia sp.]
MHIALFVVYGILCGYGILKLPLFRRSGIRPSVLLALFGLHVAAGCIHNVVAWRYYPAHGDTWGSFQSSLEWMHSGWRQFRLDNSRWTDITHNGVTVIDLLLNLASLGNLYINTLLFAFPVFAGNTALYLVFRRHFCGSALSAILVYILPSTLFWTACVFREGVLYMLLGFLFFGIDRLLVTGSPASRRARIRAVALVLCCFLLIVYFRFTVALFLVPALLAMKWIRKPSRRQVQITGILLLAGLLGVLAVPSLSSHILGGLASWQAEFQALEGHSRLTLPTMDGSWPSLFRSAPYALLNGLFEPLPGSGGRPVYLAFAIELILVWGIVILALVRSGLRMGRRAKSVSLAKRPSPASSASPGATASPVPPPSLFSFPSPGATASPVPPPSSGLPAGPFGRDGFSAACIIFALLGMIAIGAMVPFAGAIVRYRSIYLPFLLAPALCSLRRMPSLRRLNSWLENRLYFLI